MRFADVQAGARRPGECGGRGVAADVRAVQHPAVAGANLAMFAGGIGPCLLLTLITRYAQTPHGAGYGFGLTAFVAGLVLIAFSVLGFVAGKLALRVRTRIADPCSWPAAPSWPAAASPCSRRPGRTWPNCPRRWACSASVSATSRPRCPASSWPSASRARRPGQRHRRPHPRRGTGTGHLFPDDSAYTTAALIGIGAMAITTLTGLALACRRSAKTNP